MIFNRKRHWPVLNTELCAKYYR